MVKAFSVEWFRRHQLKLVRFANTSIGRSVLGLENSPVISVSPGGVSYIRGLDFKNQKLICQNISKSNDPIAFRLRKYGKPLWVPMHFIDWLALDRQRLIPNFGFTTYYSVAGDNPNYDAEFYSYGPNLSWAELRTIAHFSAVPTYSVGDAGARCGTTAGLFNYIYRSAWQFDTSGIGPVGVVTAATIYHTYQFVDATQIWSTTNYNDIVWVEFTPAVTSYCDVNDADNFQTTVFGTIAFSWASPPGSTTLSTSAIKKTDSTRLMTMARGDNVNSAPDLWVSLNNLKLAYYSVDSSYDPYLSVTYEYPVKINIGDTWKDVTLIYVNIGDSWKSLSALNINIADVWKVVF